MVEITRENLTQFNNEGFFVAKGLLDPEIDLGPIKAEYKEVLDNAVSDLQARGIIKNNYMELPFEKRISQVLEESDGELNKYLDITLPQKDINSQTPMHCGPAAFNLIRNFRFR